MNPKRHYFKLFRAIFMMILTSMTFGACRSASIAALTNNGMISICHATGVASRPYDLITIGFNELDAHANHKTDLLPTSEGVCPSEVLKSENKGKISICHTTNSLTDPYTEITINFNGLNGHSTHTDDIIPSPKNGCPAITVMPTMITKTVTPTTLPSNNNDGLITICHATGSSKNPYAMITISVNGLNGHNNHARDIIPAPTGGCPVK
jgi:hypothetical protein